MKIKTLYSITLLGAIAGMVAMIAINNRPLSPTESLPPPQAVPQETSAPQPQQNTVAVTSVSSNTATPDPIRTHQTSPVDIKTSSPSFETDSKRYPLRTYRTLAVNDPSGTQWWTTATSMETAWNIGPGTRQTSVAIIDTGFGLAHEEFTGRWMTSSGESGATTSESPSRLNCTDQSMALDRSCNLIDDNYDGLVDNETGVTTLENPSRHNCSDQLKALDKACNLIDDDSNGYIDDITGWDFANNDPNVQAGEVDPNGSGTTHGTRTTGILAATGNNGKGIAGVNWTTKILPLQALDDLGYGNTLTVARAVYYAADKNVDVISISLGADGEDPYLRQAVQYAINKGVVVVAASGNDGCDCISYPARYPEVFAVGSQNAANQPSPFSSYGANLDILAPGEDMRAPTWTQANPTTAYASGISGTSFATPYVSGLLALARSHHPSASWGDLQNALLATANHAGLSVSTPSTSKLGSGYARAGSYLSRLTTPTQPGMRYLLGPLTRLTTLGSDSVYDCRPENGFPTAPLYKITEGATTFYSTDILTSLDAVENGGTSTLIGRMCAALPGDTPQTTRTINLFTEIDTLSSKQ